MGISCVYYKVYITITFLSVSYNDLLFVGGLLILTIGGLKTHITVKKRSYTDRIRSTIPLMFARNAAIYHIDLSR